VEKVQSVVIAVPTLSALTLKPVNVLSTNLVSK
jgi:hypothetical protein